MITSTAQALQYLEDIKIFLTGSMPEIQFEQLKSLLKSKEWPLATPEALICTESESDKFERAEAILDFACGNIKNKKILDFGCGLGHVAVKASQLGAQSVGYDIVANPPFEWEVDGDCLLTTNFDRVKSLAPFDLIVAYDVLDHVKNPSEFLKQVRDLCDINTEVFIRCHPFISRHGGHLYNKINKAFVHLVFTQEELESMGYVGEYVQHIEQPLAMYHQWLHQADFRIISQDNMPDVVENFFETNALVASRMPQTNSVVGTWRHIVNGSEQMIIMFPNGRFKTIDGRETWELDGNRLTLKWPVANGVWVDKLVMNNNMKHYEGHNQLGYFIKGDKVDEMRVTFVDFVLKTN